MRHPNEYGEDVLSGRIDAGEYVRLSIARHFEDLKRHWEYYFDEEAGMRPIKFFNVLRLYEGDRARHRFIPEEWQAWCLYVIFGWKRKETGKRRFKYAYIEVPRKNGKTTFMGGISLYHIMKDDENSPNVYFVATKYDQAQECLNDAIGLAGITPELVSRLELRKQSILYPTNNGYVGALGYNPQKMDGLNPSLVIMDEFHAHPDDGMFVKMKTAFGARSQGLVLIITTAGFNRSGVCYNYRNRCIEVLRGIKKQDNLFSIIYTLDEEDDWKSEDSWKKANPSWNILDEYEFKSEAKEAISFAHAETGFKNLRLNIWTDAEHTWMKDDDWMVCAGPVRDEDLKGVKCYAGSDFAETRDLNALVLNFPLPDGTRHIKSFFWIPEKKVREKEDHVDYWAWKSEGHINVIPGDAIDHRELALQVLEVLRRYNVQGMTYDKYGIGEAVIQTMIDEGYPVGKLHPIAQKTTQMQGPIRRIEEEVSLKKINHEGHPVLRWNVQNAVLFMDSYGGVKFNKSKAIDKIDGVVALAMAFAEEMDSNANGPINYGEVRVV
jgi:phage terminase large subunit-like protein